jgi:hypothetical protein
MRRKTVKPFTEEDEYELLNELVNNSVSQFKRSFKALKGKQFTDSYMVLLKRLNEISSRLSEQSGTPKEANSPHAAHMYEHLSQIKPKNETAN